MPIAIINKVHVRASGLTDPVTPEDIQRRLGSGTKEEIQQRADTINRSIDASDRPLCVKQAMMANVTREKHFLFAKIDQASAMERLNMRKSHQKFVNWIIVSILSFLWRLFR